MHDVRIELEGEKMFASVIHFLALNLAPLFKQPPRQSHQSQQGSCGSLLSTKSIQPTINHLPRGWLTLLLNQHPPRATHPFHLASSSWPRASSHSIGHSAAPRVDNGDKIMAQQPLSTSAIPTDIYGGGRRPILSLAMHYHEPFGASKC